ncbi:CBS domain-containing protein [Malonomonas rubra DSM 5091]|uniref:CBS domain-containing protein n=1 Tax=Malonomonas rubra DSM 5091 TaxID=1122189 RepID=A0A1M6JCT2_MALRU|nr:CBS domain-containing protein [Malonomonas rubra]SHJ44493.1 CBS domain-containing protein [Malonomonas rubra DSM 5091]
MKVSECMRTEVLLAGKDCDFKMLLCKITSSNPRQVYVVDEKYKLLGLVTSMDLLREIIPSYLNADLARSFTDEADFLLKRVEKVKNKTAEEIMVTRFVYVHPHHQLLEADALIAEKGCNTLPVIDAQGRLLGEVSRRDILIRLVHSCPDWGAEKNQLVDLAKL